MGAEYIARHRNIGEKSLSPKKLSRGKEQKKTVTRSRETGKATFQIFRPGLDSRKLKKKDGGGPIGGKPALRVVNPPENKHASHPRV